MNDDKFSDLKIANILSSVKTIAVVGASVTGASLGAPVLGAVGATGAVVSTGVEKRVVFENSTANLVANLNVVSDSTLTLL